MKLKILSSYWVWLFGNILFVINSVSKNLQSKDMHIDVAIDQLKGLISYFKEYRENRFTSTMNSSSKTRLWQV